MTNREDCSHCAGMHPDPCPEHDTRYYNSSCGRIELAMTLEQAQSASHQGQCDDDVRALSAEPAIAAQLESIDPQLLIRELREWGAWDDEELADHDQNLQRFLWLAAADIAEESRQ